MHWADQLGDKIIERSKREDRTPNVKCQQTPSGGKHIGNLNDVLRAYFPVKSVRERGIECEFVHTSDDRDPLKDVPAKISDLDCKWHSSSDFPEMKAHLGKPLCRVPDPFGCCPSWSRHFTQVWMQGIYDLGVDVKLFYVDDLYKQGKFEPLVLEVFRKIGEAGRIVQEFQDSKAPGYIPFDAICPHCGVLANVSSFDLEKKTVSFTCGGKNIKNKKAEGCGLESTVPISEGKLQWRFEWPALWCMFNTTFEPFGKDHAEGSWKSGVQIMNRVFLREPPIPFVYEFFLVNGQKMSASKGNVFITQDLLKVLEPEVFMFFYVKRPEKQRDLELGDLHRLVDEFDFTERVYFGLEEDRTENREENSKRMYEFAVPQVPRECPKRPSFDLCAELSQIFDADSCIEKLRKLGHLDSSKGNEELAKRRLSLAKNWALLYAGEENKISLLDEADSRQEFSKLGEGAKRALKDVVSKIPSSSVDLKALNDSMKSVVVSQNLDAKEFYSGAYKVILGREKGPRLAPLLASLGKEFLEKRFIE